MISRPRNDHERLNETNILIFGAFTFFIFAQIITWLPRDLFGSGLNDFVYTEWLIDYSAGFVRRGLSGEITRFLSLLVPVRVAVGLLVWVLFVGLVVAYVRLIVRSLDKIGPILLVGLLFLPSLLPFYLYDHGAFGRKENIGFLVLLWHLHLLEPRPRGGAAAHVRRILPISTIALPVHLLIHEASFLLFVPVHLLISDAMIQADRSISFRRRILTLTLAYSPVLLTFLCLLLFGRPTYAGAVAICRHWESLGALPAGSAHAGEIHAYSLPGALEGLSWSFSEATALTRSIPRLALLHWSALFLVLGFCTTFIGSLVTDALASSTGMPRYHLAVFGKALPRKLLLRYFLLPFLVSLPLYFLGWDLGRWFVITCINYILITLSKAVADAESSVADDTAVEGMRTSAAHGASAFSLSFYFLLAGLLSVLFFLRIPHCCIDVSNTFADPIKSSLERLVKSHAG